MRRSKMPVVQNSRRVSRVAAASSRTRYPTRDPGCPAPFYMTLFVKLCVKMGWVGLLHRVSSSIGCAESHVSNTWSNGCHCSSTRCMLASKMAHVRTLRQGLNGYGHVVCVHMQDLCTNNMPTVSACSCDQAWHLQGCQESLNLEMYVDLKRKQNRIQQKCHVPCSLSSQNRMKHV